MTPIWMLFPPNPAEVPLRDTKVESEAEASLGPDVARMGYEMSGMKVSRLGENIIVRADVIAPDARGKIGEAIRVINKGEIREGINLNYSES